MECCHELIFEAPGIVAVNSSKIPSTGEGQLLVKTKFSAISAGTELLIYRGQFPGNLSLDSSIEKLASEIRYPLRYGYCATGEVIETGPGVDQGWVGRRIFSFQPHCSHFTASVNQVMTIPEGITLEDACFLPNLETAVNLVQDGAPLLGEDVVVFGQGIVGLLTTAMLVRFPLNRLITFDRYPLRRAASLGLGVDASLDPSDSNMSVILQSLLPRGADLVFEVSGSPEALDDALRVTGYAGRIMIGSFYGQKRASLDLGGEFHRSRIRLLSSQVSSLAPELTGRWDKARRFAVAWEMVKQIQPAQWITHRFSITHAAEAYHLLDSQPEAALQVILTYGSQD